MKISRAVLYGINADPPHLGHLKLVRELQKKMGSDTTIIVIPAGIHPFNKIQHACFEDRLNMTKLNFRDVSHVIVDDIEGRNEKPCYTLDTLMYIRSKYKADEYYFVLASDVANHFFSWHKPLAVLGAAIPIIVTRKGYYLISEVKEQFEKLSQPMFLDLDIPEISSTQIRDRIHKNEVAHDLNCDVSQYIIDHRLYSNSK